MEYHLPRLHRKIDGKIWNPKSQEYPALEAGQLARVTGFVESYRDRNQLRVDHMDLLEPCNPAVNLADFLPASCVPAEDLMEAIEDLITEHMKHKPWKNFCKNVLRDEDVRAKLMAAPAPRPYTMPMWAAFWNTPYK